MKPKVIGIGELLWDLLPTGPRMGGAPANFACHAGALGADAAVISRVGADELGEELLRQLSVRNVATSGITIDPEHPTGTVRVSIGAMGQPRFEIVPEVAWDYLSATPPLARMVEAADAVCFGTLGQRGAASRAAIRGLVAAAPPAALKVFDVNLRQQYYDRETIEASLGLANVCKLNDEELPVVAAMLGLHGGVSEQLHALVSRFRLKLAVYTKGADGSVLTNGTEWIEQPGEPTQVRDTIGAGDSFTGAVTLGLLLGWPLGRIAQSASEVAAFVCTQDGAVPDLPESLRQSFHPS